MRLGAPVAEDNAQATVEMAVVLPVLLILAILVYNVMLFVCAVARFDHVVADVVMAQAVSPPRDTGAADCASRVAASLEEAMEGYRVEVDVACEGGGAPNASTHMHATRAESMPPESPSTTSVNPAFWANWRSASVQASYCS